MAVRLKRVKSLRLSGKVVATAGVLVPIMLLASCSSSSTKSEGPGGATAASSGATSSSGASSSAPTAKTPNAGKSPGVTSSEIKLGLLASVTGFASASFGKDVIGGANAAIGEINASGGINGRKLTLVIADDASSPTQNLTAVNSLINKGVFGIVEASPVFFAGYRATVTLGIPVTGTANDGPEWSDAANANLFSAYGRPAANYPTFTTLGEFLKSNGVTKLGAIGYSNSPSSLGSTAANIASAKAAGIPTVFKDVAQPFGTANFAPDAIAMKKAGVDGLSAILGTSDNIAVLKALKEQGVSLKADFIADGYQQAILDSPSALAAAQGVMFSSRAQPVQLNTPATQAFMKALSTYANYTAANPTQGQMYGWFATMAMIKGLQVAGPNPTWGTFIGGLSQVTAYDGGGLLSPISYAQGGYDSLSAGNCWYQSRVVGNAFVPVSAKPYCGTMIAGSRNK